MPARITAANRLHDITGDSEEIQEELTALSESKGTTTTTTTTTTVDPVSQTQDEMSDQIATSVDSFVKSKNRSAKITELEARVEKCQNRINFLYFVIIVTHCVQQNSIRRWYVYNFSDHLLMAVYLILKFHYSKQFVLRKLFE
ncbi:Golgi to ER traffic protein [Trichinella pseudospiralis]